MHGVQRVPALLYTKPTSTLESMNCAKYEVLTFESLHDIGRHIENVVTELTSHLPNNEMSTIQELIDLSIGSKQSEHMIIDACLLCLPKCINCHLKKCSTPLLIGGNPKIAYSSDKNRTPKSVLRLHNLTWFHGILCREVFGFTLKNLST